ncbi:MAG: hypothetical protein HOQ21_09920 [Dermatophilaceae bacterium]|nr:hypothetical protein [Dermatophilaceae bacterium]
MTASEMKHPELVAVAVAAQLAKLVKAAGDRARLDAARILEKGSSVTLYSPLGMKIGKALRTDPEPVAEVTDPAALDAWLREKYPDQVVPVETISDDLDAVIAFLKEHAPHLVRTVEVVAERMVPDVLAASEIAGQPMGPDGELDVPGVVVRKPDGVLQIRLDKSAREAIGEMWTAGLINIDGTLRGQLTDGGE